LQRQLLGFGVASLQDTFSNSRHGLVAKYPTGGQGRRRIQDADVNRQRKDVEPRRIQISTLPGGIFPKGNRRRVRETRFGSTRSRPGKIWQLIQFRARALGPQSKDSKSRMKRLLQAFKPPSTQKPSPLCGDALNAWVHGQGTHSADHAHRLFIDHPGRRQTDHFVMHKGQGREK